MNKKPFMLRTVVAVVIVAVFASSIYPLKPLDFYETFLKLSSTQDDTLEQTMELARELEVQDNVFPSIAMERASRKLGTDLAKYIPLKAATGNKDIIGYVKQQASSSIRLGLDLHGGVEFVLEVVPDAEIEDSDGNKISIPFDTQRETAIEVLRNRLESENIFESEIAPMGDSYVTLKVPTVSKDEINAIREMLTMSARLEFKLVHKDNNSLVRKYLQDPRSFTPPEGYMVMELAKSERHESAEELAYIVRKRPEMRGRGNIAAAYVNIDSFGQRFISLTFTPPGSDKFAKITTKHVGDKLAIVLDDILYSAPVLQTAITEGRAQITGRFSQEEAARISKALMSGNLPRMRVEAIFETDPTLGAEAVRTGTMAGLYGLIAVVVFMLVYYMRAGLIANLALVANIVLIMGFMATFQATLTLPGIAGIVLTIGMAVDANVLIFERIREELKARKNLLTAIDNGYSRAFITIFDSNITTLFVALILMWQGSGPIKGFAVTLTIGIITSMFTSLFLTRLSFDILNRVFRFDSMRMLNFFSEPKFNFLAMKNLAFSVSIALVALTLLALAMFGGRSLSIDFTGGTRLTFDYNANARPSQQAVTEALNIAGFDAKVSYKTNMLQDVASEKLEIVLRERASSEEVEDVDIKSQVEAILVERFPAAQIINGSETSLGALIGMQFAWSAIVAILMAIIGIIIYISVRFEFAFAIAAIIALVHDIIVATGLYMAFGLFVPGIGSGEISLSVIAALLTIMGYSINDTIVLFDRVREDISLMENKSYKDIINLSINQTLSRTVLTSVTTLIVLVALLVSGVAAINDFVLVMTIGVVVGTYSSIFVASPIVSVWHKRIGSRLKD
ncbi:MAG: protein translocase subunit SecD [Victivallales bacterium]|nr:protein translocase subunit SecD [Victivallales bacterium]